MKSLLAARGVVAAILVAAFGGGFAVFGGYDDSPGATLLGVLVVLGAVILGARSATRGVEPPRRLREP